MSAWASADAAALKKGEASDDHFGLLLLAYPVSEEEIEPHGRATLERDHGLNGAYWMPPEHLHVTIATLRRYDAAKLNPADREVTLDEWRHILDGAKISQGWPPAPFRLRVTGATFRGGCATLDISDEDGAIAAMRSALELSIRARGGHAVAGGVGATGRPRCAADDPAPVCRIFVIAPSDPADDPPPHRRKRDAGHEVGGGAERPDAREGRVLQIAGPLFAPAAVVDEKPPERVYTKYGSHVPGGRRPAELVRAAAVAVVESSPFMRGAPPLVVRRGFSRRPDMTPLWF